MCSDCRGRCRPRRGQLSTGLTSEGPMKEDQEYNIRFVKSVERHRCVYDFTLVDYSNRERQEKAWRDIANEMSSSVSDCKERWRNLRGCLTRHLKRNGDSGRLKKPYYLTEHMQFVVPFTKTRSRAVLPFIQDGLDDIFTTGELGSKLTDKDDLDEDFDLLGEPNDSTIRAIEAFREKRALWDQSHRHFKERQKKHEAWNELDSEMGAGLGEVERKIRRLVGQFQRELKKGRIAEEGSPWRSQWVFFRPLMFLKDRTVKHRSAVTHMLSTPSEQDLTNCQEEMETEGGNPGSQIHSKIYVAVQPTQRPITDHNADLSRLNINTVSIKEEPVSFVESSLSPLPLQQQIVIGKRANSPEDSEESNLEYFKIKRLKEERDLADPDMNFFISLLPDVRSMNAAQKRKMKIGLLKLIDEILA